MPRATLPSEENSRLFSLYMRPWTLNSDDVAEHNPLLTDLRRAETAEVDNVSARRTYVLGWRWYIQGHVTSQQQRRFIQNLLMATAAKVAEQPGEVSSDSEEVDYKRHDRTIGDMKLVHRTIDGLQADDEDTEQGPFGQYFECISRGRALWQRRSPQRQRKSFSQRLCGWVYSVRSRSQKSLASVRRAAQQRTTSAV